MTYNETLKTFEKNYLGYATLGLLFQSSLGAIATMMILHQRSGTVQHLELLVVVVACMLYNAAFLAQFKIKHVFNLLIFSIGISVVTIVISEIFRVI